MWKCKHCKEKYDYTSTSEKANHSRWCEKNPKRNEWKKYKSSENKFGLKIRFCVSCSTCCREFEVTEREKLHPQKEEYFCSRSCANSKGGVAKSVKYGNTQYVTIAKKHHKEECVICGVSDVLDVHHIDGNRKNNAKENLVFLCPNDHARLHRNKDQKVIKGIQ